MWRNDVTQNPEMGLWVEPKKLGQGHVARNASGAQGLLQHAGPDWRKKGGLPGGGVMAAGPDGSAAPGRGSGWHRWLSSSHRGRRSWSRRSWRRHS